jgi:regulation of enolase protein 1 (concanavalin A-like superfamily)
MAAPAPLPRAGTWVTGWDKPVGEGRFVPEGDKLGIIVLGSDDAREVWRGRLGAPRLLRDVEGDFAVQVRVRGNFQVDPQRAFHFRRAGILLTDGKEFVRVELAESPLGALFHISTGLLGKTTTARVFADNLPTPEPGHLSLERRGDTLVLKASKDGKRWEPLGDPLRRKLPRRVKVGVVADATTPGPFKPVFDQFKLTPLK